MDLPQTFYKEIPTDRNNIFLANLAENNVVEQVLLLNGYWSACKSKCWGWCDYLWFKCDT